MNTRKIIGIVIMVLLLLLCAVLAFLRFGAAKASDAAALRESLAERFYALDIRDHTRMAEDIWARAGEDSLRGLFLRELRAKWDAAGSEEERETVTRAVRFGLAALDHRDLG